MASPGAERVGRLVVRSPSVKNMTLIDSWCYRIGWHISRVCYVAYGNHILSFSRATLNIRRSLFPNAIFQLVSLLVNPAFSIYASSPRFVQEHAETAEQ